MTTRREAAIAAACALLLLPVCNACEDGAAAGTTSGSGGAGATTPTGGAGGTGGQLVADCSDGWCLIPAGTFVMGSAPGEIDAAAFAENQVETTITRPFFIQQTELTEEQRATLGFNVPISDHCGGAPDCPATYTTWFDAVTLANAWSDMEGRDRCYQLSDCTGTPGRGLVCAGFTMPVPSVYECEGYRLPTEAEWEYATRAGTTTATYGGDLPSEQIFCLDAPALNDIAWYCHNAPEMRVQRVGLKAPNAWGLHDTIGNVWEWAHGRFTSMGYGEGPLVDPLGGDEQAQERTLRGGRVDTGYGQNRAGERQPWSWGAAVEDTAGVRLARTKLD